ncbi:hypothetical protein N9B53_01190 [Mariniblastus sp.]|nr:hypothetical protein [Mariniblastus sp.]
MANRNTKSDAESNPQRTDDDIGMAEAAFHEAGHSLAMRSCGLSLSAAKIWWDDELKQWNGKVTPASSAPSNEQQTPADLKVKLVQGATNSVAGCLAQTFYVARLRESDAQFQLQQNWHALFNWMKHERPEEIDPFPFAFNSCSGQFVVPAMPRSFGGVDRGYYMRMVLSNLLDARFNESSFYSNFEDGLVSFVSLLNHPKRWNQVTLLAAKLIQGCKGKSEFELTANIDQIFDE